MGFSSVFDQSLLSPSQTKKAVWCQSVHIDDTDPLNVTAKLYKQLHVPACNKDFYCVAFTLLVAQRQS